ncbi:MULTISPECIES: ArsB/NhaD family transporter [Glycomyces]|uniref:ArsB/NhaD family transporter n=2 Tax=Glycomyces TaxID=58113 RepID=A0A9X3STF1_9ACTN|nr:SLC13 family permease [Glycomyces lechevalierae]MDA1384210.1 ArsB/NhaD family transporter [Glycomyces lechevalierae]MDR7339360.1 arsenical pump membrane protein [Glycomyces lechevalierae]
MTTTPPGPADPETPAGTATRETRKRRRLEPLDLVSLGILAVGLLCWATGVLPTSDALANLARVAPLVLFLGTVMVMVAIVQASQLFDLAAAALARAGRGSHLALFAYCFALATATTVFLNLDTTIVLLTPVMLALAAVTRAPALALAMTTVWLANTASLLLPVSNLTNLLAADRIGLDPLAFASRMWAPQLAVLAVTALCLWFGFWRRRHRELDRYRVPERLPAIADKRLLWTAAVVTAGFVAAVVADVPIQIVSSVAAGLLLVHCLRRRDLLAWELIPWRLLVLTAGLFLVIPAVMRHGGADAVAALIGSGTGDGAVLRAGLTGAGLSNLVNNLPAYTAVEGVVPAGDSTTLLGLLIGTNVGPLILPWASMATLLWFDLVRAGAPGTPRLRIPMGRFIAAGALLATTGTLVGLAALLWL